MKTIVAFWAAAIAIVGGLLFWRNRAKYARKSVVWLIGKSAAELVVLFLTAAYLPALLIAWLVVWITRPIKRPWVRTTVGVITGVFFGFMSNIALEILVLIGVFSIDMKTGAHDQGGFLHCWRRAKLSEAAKHRQTATAAA